MPGTPRPPSSVSEHKRQDWVAPGARKRKMREESDASCQFDPSLDRGPRCVMRPR
jgi:hypothetical protein